MKLMLKGSRCETAKCPVEKKQRNLAPGMHGWRRGRASEYGVRLREKQKDIMAFLSSSLCDTSIGLKGLKAIQVRIYFSFWKDGLTMWFTS
jgi:hypothetical protein